MHKNQKALIRKINIFTRLNVGETINIKDLVDEFGVSERTIQNDIKDLSKMHDIVNLGHKNYRFAKGYRIRQSKDEEKRIAISLMKALQISAIPQMNEYVDDVLSINKKYEKMFLFDLDFEPIKNFMMFKVILQAIDWKNAIEFNYNKRDGSSKKVSAHPYRIANFKNFWYLIAYDLRDERIKAYHFNSISKVHNLGENFILDRYEELDRVCSNIDSAYYKKEPHKTKLQLTNNAKFYLLRHLPKNMKLLEKNSDFAIVEVSYRHDNEILSIIKRWLPDIKIIDNPQLYQKLKSTLINYLNS